jgi:hypothetical protein
MATHTRRQFTLPKLLLPVAQNYRGRGTKEFIDADAPPAHLPPVGGLVQLRTRRSKNHVPPGFPLDSALANHPI